jgi:hypothetical protein
MSLHYYNKLKLIEYYQKNIHFIYEGRKNMQRFNIY